MANKILGYILLALGLAIIGYVCWQSFNIFTGLAPAPQLFKTATPVQQLTAGKNLDLQSQLNETIQKQFNQILSPDIITKTLNLAAWGMLAFIFITAGGAISGIGVKLINGSK